MLAFFPPPVKTLEVYAAVSLKEAFGTISRAFAARHHGVSIRLTFGGSQTLAAQIANGASADVFASASAKNLEGLAYDPLTRKIFATNKLVVASSTHPISLRNLAKTGKIVLAAPAVPAGGYADAALKAAGQKWGSAWFAAVQSRIVSRENDVRSVLAKIVLGEADAGIVYASDAVSAGKKVRAVAIPAAFQPRIEYPAVALSEAKEPELAKKFINLLRSPAGVAALKAQGFGPAGK